MLLFQDKMEVHEPLLQGEHDGSDASVAGHTGMEELLPSGQAQWKCFSFLLGQSGNGNDSVVDQSGNGNASVLGQNGNGNASALGQSGDGDPAVLGQNGNGKASFSAPMAIAMKFASVLGPSQ
jgi:hypothetical protein